MASKRALERQLATLTGFTTTDPALEQYATPPDLAATLVHRAALDDTITGRTVIDLGTGNGILAIAAATRRPNRVIGLDRDPTAIAIAVENEQALDLPIDIDWIRGDAAAAPLCTTGTTVLMNPPFGAHRAHTHADRAFLETAARIADTSYSIHNAGSEEFITAFAADHDATVTQSYAGTIDLPRQYDHHTEDMVSQPVEIHRIDWHAP